MGTIKKKSPRIWGITDNAKEYLFRPFSSFLSSHRILHQSSCANTPQQNGVTKCKNRHLVETSRTLLLHHKVPQRFWGDATLAAYYLINRMSSPVLHDKISYSILFPNQPLFCLPLVSLVVFVLSIFLLLDKTSFQSNPQSVSSSVIPDFNEVIVATLLIHIDTLSLAMSHFLRTLLYSLSTTLPVLMSYLYLLIIPSQIPHLYLQILHLDHCRFILVTRVLTLGLRLTHLLWHPPPRHWSCRLPFIFPLPFTNVLYPLITPILFIIS